MSQLNERRNQLLQQMTQSAKVLESTQPRIFVSYAREDEKGARVLCDKLFTIGPEDVKAVETALAHSLE